MKIIMNTNMKSNSNVIVKIMNYIIIFTYLLLHNK